MGILLRWDVRTINPHLAACEELFDRLLSATGVFRHRADAVASVRTGESPAVTGMQNISAE
jgi:hypothetical protein